MRAARERKPAGRRERSQETRRRLLEASLRLFVHKGYVGTRVRDIAQEAGVSAGLMFHYFPSKEALLEEHARTMAEGVAAVAGLLESARRPLPAFTAVASMVLDALRDESTRNLFLLSSQVVLHDSIPRSVKRRVSTTRSIDASVPLIRAGQKRGEVRPGDPMALAVAFWGALQGIAQVLVTYPAPVIPPPEVVMAVLRP
jgi:AcrR family transcriptional regulator